MARGNTFTGKELIRHRLPGIMNTEEANACSVFKGWAYSAGRSRYGWHIIPFGENPEFLGNTIAEALEWIENCAEGE